MASANQNQESLYLENQLTSLELLTLSFIMFKNGQTYFKNLAFKKHRKILKYDWPFFNVFQEKVKPISHQFPHLLQCSPVFCRNCCIIIESTGRKGKTDRKAVKNS